MDPASAEAAPQAKPAAERLDGGVALIGTQPFSTFAAMRVVLLLLLAVLPGCLTFSGDKLPEIAPPTSVGAYSFELGFRDFSYSLDGGALQSSATMADKITSRLGGSWVRHGYASRVVQRGRAAGTGASDYMLTMTGNLDGESSVVLQVISGLTLLIIPHTIDAHAFLVFELKRESDGATFKASVAEDVNQVTWLPFILGLPWMEAGADHAVEKMALHLYQQFAAQGAFGSAPSKSKQEPTSAPAESRD